MKMCECETERTKLLREVKVYAYFTLKTHPDHEQKCTTISIPGPEK